MPPPSCSTPQWGSVGAGGPWETRVPWLSQEPPLDLFLHSFSRLFPQTLHTPQPLRFPTCCAGVSAISAWVALASAWTIQLRVTLRAVTFKHIYIYSCLKNPMDRGVWRPTVLGATKSQTRKSIHTRTDTHTHIRIYICYWNIVDWQCCTGFRCTVQFSYIYLDSFSDYFPL